MKFSVLLVLVLFGFAAQAESHGCFSLVNTSFDDLAPRSVCIEDVKVDMANDAAEIKVNLDGVNLTARRDLEKKPNEPNSYPKYSLIVKQTEIFEGGCSGFEISTVRLEFQVLADDYDGRDVLSLTVEGEFLDSNDECHSPGRSRKLEYKKVGYSKKYENQH